MPSEQLLNPNAGTRPIPPTGEPASVLVVSDDPVERTSLARALDARGHEVVALGYAEAPGRYAEGRFSLVVLAGPSREGPSLSPLSLCRSIRADGRDPAPVLVVIGPSADPGTLVRLFEAGADDFVTAPVDEEGLHRRLALAEARLTARSPQGADLPGGDSADASEQEAGRRQLRALLRIAAVSLGGADTSVALERILDEVSETTGMPIAVVELLDRAERRTVVAASRGLPPSPGGRPLVLPLDESPSADVLRTGRPVVESEHGRRPGTDAGLLAGLGVETRLSYPLSAAGETIGVLTLAGPRTASPSGELARWGGVLAGLVAAVVQRRRAEEGLRRSEERHRTLVEQLRRANEELEAFAWTVSHDLRAPLRTMQGFAHALLQDFGSRLDPRARDFARRIIASGQRSETLIRDLLEYSRLSYEDVHLQAVDLEDAIRTALEQLDGDLRAASARVVVETPVPAVLGHHTMLVQVVANLLSNAVKFRQEDRRPEIRVGTESVQGGVRLWVEDNGIGIPQEQQARIFRTFERLEGSTDRPGTGIGLAIVRKSMERMGGSAGVTSVPGQGSRFWIELPRPPSEPWAPWAARP